MAGVGLLLADWAGKRGWLNLSPAGTILRISICLGLLAGLGFLARYVRESRWQHHGRIENPVMPPATMDGEGDGPKGPFFPSSAQVYGGQKIPSKFFMESESCKRCHQDIYNQWFSSAHHFSSFNNQWYRKSIEYMQDTVGTKPFEVVRRMPRSRRALQRADGYSDQANCSPPRIAGRPRLHDVPLHRRREKQHGPGDFYLEYPKLHELAATKNPIVRSLHDFLVKLNPEPHRRVFLKPFMREQTAEFCSSCHKVHLDVPVNHYRWFRGFNEYDNWQASGVSGQGARSFYYPPNPAAMRRLPHAADSPSNDFGNIDGKVHSHRFPAANTALPTANEDTEQLKITEDFLKNGF